MKHLPTVAGILLGLIFIMKGATLLDPMLIVIVLHSLCILWAGRKNSAGLLS